MQLVDVGAIDAAASELAAAFPDPWIRQYSVKANDVRAVVAAVGRRGLGANVVSRGEWAIATRAGIANGRVTLEGVGKTDADLRAAVAAAARGDALLWVTIEGPEEADVLTRLAERAGLGRRGRPSLDVMVRLNPDVTPETHAGLAVGAGSSKFGLADAELAALVESIASRRGHGLRLRGIHLHVGSQLSAVDA
ncbi:MAG: hypothetical protein ACJ761_09375, partial [Chloroflexota bacterium]